MNLRHFQIGLMAMAVFLSTVLSDFTTQFVLVPEALASPRPIDGSSHNRVLLAAASPFEDLTEAALAHDAQGMRQALKIYGEQAATVNQVLPAPARQEMASLITKIRQAEQQGNNQSVALNSVEAYRVLVEALDPQSLVVPIQVSRLDYVGFKLKVLLAATPPDWSSIQKTSEAAGLHWHALGSHVADKGLHDAVKTVMAGLNQAIGSQNVEMAVFAAQMDLALVDLLEEYFQRAAK
jgi:hypothetical protein